MMNLWQKIQRLVRRYPGCPPHEDLFEFTLDGLPLERGQQVREHLARCYGCREQIKEYAWVNEGIALNAPLAEAPDGLCDKVKDRIRRDPDQAPPPIRYAPGAPLEGWPLFWMRLGPVFALSSLLMTFVAFSALMSQAKAPSDPLVLHTQTLLESPKARTVSLKGVADGKCAGKVILAEGMDHLLIQVKNLKPCSLGRVYSVWFCGDAKKACRLAGFQTESMGEAEYLLKLAKPLEMDPGLREIRVLLGNSGQGRENMEGELHLKGQVDL